MLDCPCLMQIMLKEKDLQERLGVVQREMKRYMSQREGMRV